MSQRQTTQAREPGRLLLLATEFPPGPGGIGTHAFELARHLTGRGWQVHVVSPQPYLGPDEVERFNRRQGFAITSLNGQAPVLLRQLGRGAATMAAAWRIQADVLLASGGRALRVAAALAPALGRPWLAVGHGAEFLAHARVAAWTTARALNRASALVAVSRYTASLMQRAAPDRTPIVIPNGVDGLRFRPEAQNQALLQELGLLGKSVLLTVGNVSERKAQDVVIKALPQIRRECPDVAYLMVGLATCRPELQQLARSLQVDDIVHFAGIVPEDRLPAYYNLCQLFVLLSRNTATSVEGYGIVVKEAALCGKAAVVSSSGGLGETVRDGQTGLVVPPDDIDEAAGAVVRLLQDGRRRQRMEQAALSWAQQSTWEQRVAQYDRVLQDLLPVH